MGNVKVLYKISILLFVIFLFQSCKERNYHSAAVNPATESHPGKLSTQKASEKQKSIKGKVVGISDGDTFAIVFDNDFSIKIRLNGIDCPERKQPFSKKAKQELSNLIFDKTVTIVYENKDRYGRVLGNVFVDGLNVNAEMVKRGMAWHFKKYSNDEKLAEYEITARENKIGLWVDSNPIAPWDYRNKKN